MAAHHVPWHAVPEAFGNPLIDITEADRSVGLLPPPDQSSNAGGGRGELTAVAHNGDGLTGLHMVAGLLCNTALCLYTLTRSKVCCTWIT